MPAAEYFARQAFMAGSDGAVQVSKPAMAPFGLDVAGLAGGGLGAGLSASTGAGWDAGGGLGGSDQAAAIPVGGAGSFGQAGFTASTTTGWATRIESPVRTAAAPWAGQAVASICSMAPGSAP